VTRSPTVTLRPVRAADAPFLRILFASTRERELAALGDAQRDVFLALQLEAQARHYRTHHASAHADVIERGGVAIGRIVILRGREAIRVVDVALLPEHRSLGIGSALLRTTCAEAAASGCPVRLQVERTNRARHLYERLGFRVLGDDGMYLDLEWRPPVAGDQPNTAS
jgi:ribosomal protein S18 acetylase RimI-like enzyme